MAKRKHSKGARNVGSLTGKFYGQLLGIGFDCNKMTVAMTDQFTSMLTEGSKAATNVAAL